MVGKATRQMYPVKILIEWLTQYCLLDLLLNPPVAVTHPSVRHKKHLFPQTKRFWLLVKQTHLKNVSQIGKLPQIGVKI